MTDEGYNKQLLNVLFGLYAAHKLNGTFVIPPFVFSDHNLEDRTASNGQTRTWDDFFDFESYCRDSFTEPIRFAIFQDRLYERYGDEPMTCHLYNDKIFYDNHASKDSTQFMITYQDGSKAMRWVWNWKLKQSVKLSRIREKNVQISDHITNQSNVWVNDMPWDTFKENHWTCFVGEKMGQILPEKFLLYYFPNLYKKIANQYIKNQLGGKPTP